MLSLDCYQQQTVVSNLSIMNSFRINSSSSFILLFITVLFLLWHANSPQCEKDPFSHPNRGYKFRVAKMSVKPTENVGEPYVTNRLQNKRISTRLYMQILLHLWIIVSYLFTYYLHIDWVCSILKLFNIIIITIIWNYNMCLILFLINITLFSWHMNRNPINTFKIIKAYKERKLENKLAD